MTELHYEKVAGYHVPKAGGQPPIVERDGKSKCGSDIDLSVAQRLLDSGYRQGAAGNGFPKKVFACHDGTWYEAHPHGPGKYHGFPVHVSRVPPPALRR